MRILHIIPSYIPAKVASGAISLTHAQNKMLVSRGHEVTVCTTNLDAGSVLDVPVDSPVIIDGVKVIYFRVTWKVWQYSKCMQDWLMKHGNEFDIIHVTSVFLQASRLGAQIACKFNKPFILTTHGSLMSEPLKHQSLKKKIYIRLLEKKNIEQAVMHFTVESEITDFEKLGIKSKGIVLIPNIFDIPQISALKNPNGRSEFRKKWGIGEGKKVFLSIGRLDWIKGFDTLIPAFAKVTKKDQDALLVIAGFGDYKATIDALIKEQKIEDRVIFTGPLWGREKIQAFEASDIFVQPSYTEAGSIALIEALYFGLPVIITKTNGFASEVLRVNAGLVVEKEESAYAEALLDLLNNDAKRREMGQAGTELIKNTCAPDIVTDQWIDLYSRLIENNSR